MAMSLFDRIYYGLITPVRVLQTLYDLGLVLDRNPHALHVSFRPYQVEHAPTDDGQTVSSAGSEDHSDEGFQLEEPASASQVYHAAILNGSTLDDLLAVFEVAESTEQLPNSYQPHLSSSHPDLGTSSIQATPESMLTPRKASGTLTDSNHKADKAMVSKKFYGQLVQKPAVEATQTGSKNATLASQQSIPATEGCCRVASDVLHDQPCENAAPGHSECPTFARRQARSRLPRRTQADFKHGLETEKTSAGPTNVSASPMSAPKRNRLQRRPKVL